MPCLLIAGVPGGGLGRAGACTAQIQLGTPAQQVLQESGNSRCHAWSQTAVQARGVSR